MIGLWGVAWALAGQAALAPPSAPLPANAVSIDVSHDSRGAATGCRVLKPSGDAKVDSSICDLVMAGRTGAAPPPAEKTVGTKLVMEADPVESGPKLLNAADIVAARNNPSDIVAAFESASVFVSVDVDRAGMAVRCKVVRPSGASILDKATCPNIIALGRFAVGPGNAPRRSATMAIRWESEFPEPQLLNLPGLFSSDDYPVDALREEKTGLSVVAVGVNSTGRPVTCAVRYPSGTPSLDAATCRILLERGRFAPFEASPKGPPLRTSVKRIRWQLPEWAPVADMRFEVIYLIDAKQEFEGCRRVQNGAPVPSMPPCEISAVARKFLSDLKAEGEPVVGRNLIFTAGWLIGSTEVAESIGKGHGEQLLGLVAVDLSIDAEGNVVDCVMIEEFGTREGSSTTLCEDALKMNFEPLDMADANRTNRHVVQFSSVTLKAASVR